VADDNRCSVKLFFFYFDLFNNILRKDMTKSFFFQI
jgi:hypothetical protein